MGRNLGNMSSEKDVMIIFLYGSDTYRSRQKLNEIVEGYKKSHKTGLNLKWFEGENLEFEELKNEIQQASIIAGKKMLILKNVFSDSIFKEKFLKSSKNFINLKDLILFYEEKEVKETDSLFKFLKKSGKCQKFDSLEGQNLKSWIKKEFDAWKVRVEPAAIDRLVNFVGGDSWRLSNEIRKLAAYQKDGVVDSKDVGLLVKPGIETDIFKTIDALAQKNKKLALELLHKHLTRGDSPLYLLSMVNFQFRNLLEVKGLAEKNCTYEKILKETKLHPYVVRKSLWQSQKFTLPELKKIYRKIFKVDYDIKTGKMEPATALDLLITEI
jgi:DNA polymerase-3 subunit delta